jgi:ribosomal protein S18 acetylase RimI-like enzyme
MSRTQEMGLAVAIRPVRAADLPAVGDFFAGLSMQSRYLRFFSPITPGPSLLNLLCGGDGTTDAVLAIRDGAIVGHGMAADRSGPCGPRATDIGVVVSDLWQHQGVGSTLVRALVTGAQVRGVTSVTMDVMHGNDRALAMIKGHWPAARTRRSSYYATICVQLVDYQEHRRRDLPARPGTRQSAPLAAAGRV